MKKILAVIFFSLTLAIAPSAAMAGTTLSNPQSLSDSPVTSADINQFNIIVPHDLDPGFHQMTVQIYSNSGVQQEKIIKFCKEPNGRVHWNNICTDMDPVLSKSSLEKITDRAKLPKYLAAMEPKKQVNNIIAGLAALTLIITGNDTLTQEVLGRKPDRAPTGKPEDDTEGDIESIEKSRQSRVKKKQAWGDRSRTYRLLPWHLKIDHFFEFFPLKIDRFAPIVARSMTDGDYIRAIWGTLSLLTYGLAIFAGIGGAHSVGRQALPPLWSWALAIALLGVFDSFAGLLASVAYFASILFAGNINSTSTFLTVIATCTLFFAPTLIAASIRPFRREAEDHHDRWALITDIALAPLLAGWAASKIVSGLPGFAKLQLPIAPYADRIGLVVGLAILARILIEGGAVRLYPERLNHVTTDFPEGYLVQRITSAIFRTYVFYFLAGQFIGFNKFLYIGTAMFAIPVGIDSLFRDRIPKSPKLHRLLPKGVILALLLIFAGAFITAYVQSQFTSTLAFFRWTFVAVSIPVFIFHLLDLFIIEPDEEHWRTKSTWHRVLWEVGGVLIYVALALIVFGYDLPNHLRHWIGF